MPTIGEPAHRPEPGGAHVRDRVRGCLLTAACGDALGAPFEGAVTVDPDALTAWQHDRAPLRYTDDTALMRTLADHLVRAARDGEVALHQDRLAREFARTWAAEPHRGYGHGAVGLLHAVHNGAAWSDVARAAFGGTGSFGNGGAMRVAPVGLLPLPVRRLAELARHSAEVTHAHPLALDGAAVQAVAVAYAHRSTFGRPLDPVHLLDTVTPHATTPEFHARLTRLRDLVRGGYTPGDVARRIGNDVSSVAAVPAALAAFLHSPDDPVAALRFAVLVGGDTDTIAAMTGAVAGARNGATPLPGAWLDRLEHRALLDGLAHSLARLHG